jgi:hypothetical protein
VGSCRLRLTLPGSARLNLVQVTCRWWIRTGVERVSLVPRSGANMQRRTGEVRAHREDRVVSALRQLIIGCLINRPVPNLRRDLMDAYSRFTDAADLGRDLAFAMESELEGLRLERRMRCTRWGPSPRTVHPIRPALRTTRLSDADVNYPRMGGLSRPDEDLPAGRQRRGGGECGNGPVVDEPGRMVAQGAFAARRLIQ